MRPIVSSASHMIASTTSPALFLLGDASGHLTCEEGHGLEISRHVSKRRVRAQAIDGTFAFAPDFDSFDIVRMMSVVFAFEEVGNAVRKYANG